MIKTEELRPCPFCGGTNMLVLPRTCDQNTPYDPNDRAMPAVRCMTCYGEAVGKDWTGPDTAIAAWNRRSSDEQAEVVAWRVRAKNLMGKFPWRVVADDMLATALPEDQRHLYEIVPLYASPSGVKAGVTETMVDRAMDRAAWTVKPSPAEYETGSGALIDLGMSQDEADHLNAELRGEMREILTAALGEGMGEGWQPIETARKVVDETVLLRIEHINFAIAAPEDKHRWEELCTAYWTDFNSGGWVWHGLAGQPTHWRPISGPTPPIQGDAK